jgi:hypothetical protein
MTTKVQSQLLVSPVTRDRADALALVMEVPRAEVYRMALEGGGLAALERSHHAGLAGLADLAATMGFQSHLELARRAAADGFKLEGLAGRKRYPGRK